MANVFCNDDGDNSDGSTWAKAYTTLQAAITAAGAGGTVWLGDTHAESYNAANQTLTLPAAGNEPVRVISSDVLTGTSVEYKKPTAAQFSTVGNYDITFDGAASFVGVWFSVGDDYSFNAAVGEPLVFEDSILSYSAASKTIAGSPDAYLMFGDCEFILADTGAVTEPIVIAQNGCRLVIKNPTFSGTLTYRTDELIAATTDNAVILNGGDYSGFTGAAKIIDTGTTYPQEIFIDGIKIASGVVLYDAMGIGQIAPRLVTRSDGNNYGLQYPSYLGEVIDGDKTRDSGASDGDRHSWKVVTGAQCMVGREFYTPWMPVWVSTTGSKTFTVYIANADADLTDTQCWLEVEHLATTSSTVPTYTTDRNADLLATGTAQTDDAASDWDTDLTYMQSLAVTGTVNKAGLQRCRVGFSKASATVYVDPMVTVS